MQNMYVTYYLSAEGKALFTTASKPGAIFVTRGNIVYKRFSIMKTKKTVCKTFVVEYDNKGELIVK